MKTRYIILIWALLVLIGLWFFTLPDVANAEDINEENLLHCVLGEARSQGYNEMLAIAEVIRRRGSTKGVYGCFVDFSNEIGYMEAVGIIKVAKKAISASKTTNSSNYATHFEGIKFKKPKWAYSMQEVARIGDTVFYRN